MPSCTRSNSSRLSFRGLTLVSSIAGLSTTNDTAPVFVVHGNAENRKILLGSIIPVVAVGAAITIVVIRGSRRRRALADRNVPNPVDFPADERQPQYTQRPRSSSVPLEEQDSSMTPVSDTLSNTGVGSDNPEQPGTPLSPTDTYSTIRRPVPAWRNSSLRNSGKITALCLRLVNLPFAQMSRPFEILCSAHRHFPCWSET